MEKRVRNTKIEFYVTEEEKVKLLFLTKEHKFANLSVYLRFISLNPVIYSITVDNETLLDIREDLYRMGNNVNQVAKELHKGIFFSDEIEELLGNQRKMVTSFRKLYSRISKRYIK